MMNSTKQVWLAMAVLIMMGAPAGRAEAGIIYSYDASLGTLPTSQGWQLTDSGGSPAPSIMVGALHQGPTSFSGRQYWSQSSVARDFTTESVTMRGTLVLLCDIALASSWRPG
jgi:hypothetical protein